MYTKTRQVFKMTNFNLEKAKKKSLGSRNRRTNFQSVKASQQVVSRSNKNILTTKLYLTRKRSCPPIVTLGSQFGA